MGKKIVVILTEGGRTAGWGHVTRCVSMSQAFIEKRLTVKLIVKGDASARNFLQKTNFAIFDWLRKKNKLFRLLRGAEIVVVDSYVADFSFYKKVSTSAKIAAYMDDHKRLMYPHGLIINGAPGAEGIQYPGHLPASCLRGALYALLRKEFWEVPRKTIRKDIKKIMISFGGFAPGFLISQVTRFLSSEYPDVSIRVILGKRPKDSRAMEKRKGTNTIFTYGADALTMRKIMLESDLAISAGGQTLNELARIGVPTIGICVAENQKQNLKGFSEKGFIEDAGWHHEKTLLHRLKRSIEALKPYEERMRRSAIGKKLVDGKGASRIVAAILGREKALTVPANDIHLRPAKVYDCRDLWRWRNHPTVRGRSFAAGKIEYSEHKTWFKNKLKDRHTKIYIAEKKNADKIGQIRFEFDRRSSSVHVNLNPRFLGKGFGPRVIKEGTVLFMKRNPIVRSVTARIMDSNAASKKAFQNAGYAFSHEIHFKNKKVAIFKYGV